MSRNLAWASVRKCHPGTYCLDPPWPRSSPPKSSTSRSIRAITRPASALTHPPRTHLSSGVDPPEALDDGPGRLVRVDPARPVGVADGACRNRGHRFPGEMLVDLVRPAVVRDRGEPARPCAGSRAPRSLRIRMPPKALDDGPVRLAPVAPERPVRVADGPRPNRGQGLPGEMLVHLA